MTDQMPEKCHIFIFRTAVYALRHDPLNFKSYSRTSGESNHHRQSVSAVKNDQLSHEDDYQKRKPKNISDKMADRMSVQMSQNAMIYSW